MPIEDATALFQSRLPASLATLGPQWLDFPRVAAFTSEKKVVRTIYAEPAPAAWLSMLLAAYEGTSSDERKRQIPHLTLARVRSPADSQWARTSLVGAPLHGRGVCRGVSLLGSDGSGTYKDIASQSFGD